MVMIISIIMMQKNSCSFHPENHIIVIPLNSGVNGTVHPSI